jgi:hypothetical protein
MQNAMSRDITAAMKGLIFASDMVTANWAVRPAPIVTTLLSVVMRPNIELKLNALLIGFRL